MGGWHHLLNGHEFEQAPGDSEGHGSLACCSPWDHIEADMAEQLNNNHTFRHGMIPACAMMSVGIVSVITSLDKRPTVQFSSVKSLSCVQLFVDPMAYSTPGLPVHHQLPEFAQIHAH